MQHGQAAHRRVVLEQLHHTSVRSDGDVTRTWSMGSVCRSQRRLPPRGVSGSRQDSPRALDSHRGESVHGDMAPRSSAALIGLALVAPLAVCAALSAARGTVESDNAVLVLVLVVVAAAASGSRLAGVVAALSSAAWFDYFLTRPFHHFTIADRDDVETAVLLTLVGIAVTEIALWGRRQQARLSVREGYLTGVISAADVVARGEATPKVVLDFIGQQIVDLLAIDSCTYAVGPPGAHARLERDGSVTGVARSSTWTGRVCPSTTSSSCPSSGAA